MLLLDDDDELPESPARVVHEALNSGCFAVDDDTVDLHVRRVASLVTSGKLESQGNLRRPR